MTFNITNSQLRRLPDLDQNEDIMNISVFQNKYLEDVECLKAFIKAKIIKMYANCISSIGFACYLDSLNYLDISNNRISSLEPLCKNMQLTYLDASRNQLSTINGVQQLSLRYLDVSNNKLTLLELFNPSLTYLRADDNQLASINVKQSLQLQRLSLRNNELDELNCLQGFMFLSYVNVINNPMCSEEFFLRKVKKLNLINLNKLNSEVVNVPQIFDGEDGPQKSPKLSVDQIGSFQERGNAVEATKLQDEIDALKKKNGLLMAENVKILNRNHLLEQKTKILEEKCQQQEFQIQLTEKSKNHKVEPNDFQKVKGMDIIQKRSSRIQELKDKRADSYAFSSEKVSSRQQIEDFKLSTLQDKDLEK